MRLGIVALLLLASSAYADDGRIHPTCTEDRYHRECHVDHGPQPPPPLRLSADPPPEYLPPPPPEFYPPPEYVPMPPGFELPPGRLLCVPGAVIRLRNLNPPVYDCGGLPEPYPLPPPPVVLHPRG